MTPNTRKPICAALLLAVVAGAACSSPQPSPSPSSAGPSATLEAIDEGEIVRAIEFRTRFGLRADREWVESVARNPESAAEINEFGFPLTHAEVADLRTRVWDPNLLALVTQYGSVFPEFSGAYPNLQGSGVVIEFSSDVDRHRRALQALVPEGAILDVRKVDWSLAELDAFRKRVDEEAAWLESIGVTYVANVYGTENYVRVRFRGRPEAANLIEAHFGSPTWLKADWDGPLPWRGPTGHLIVRVVDARGLPVRGLGCLADPIDPMVDDPGEDFSGTDEAGVCDLRSRPAVTYLVRIYRQSQAGNGGWDLSPIAEAEVDLLPSGTTAEITLPPR